MTDTNAHPRSPHETSIRTGIPSVPLEPDPSLPTGDPINATVAQLLPEQVCRYFRMMPVGYEGESLTLAMADPHDSMAENVAFALTRSPINIVASPPHQIDRAIDRIWGNLGHYDPQAEQAAEPYEPRTPESASVAARGRLGEILIQRGLISEDKLRTALSRQEQGGSRLGEILHHEMGLSEDDLASALADQLRVPLVDLDGIEPPPEALELIPEALQREGRCVPLAVDETSLYVGITDPLDDETYEAIRQLTDLRIRTYMVTRSDLEALLREIHLGEDVRADRTELLRRFLGERANRGLSGLQRVVLILFLVAILIGLVLAPLRTAIVLVALCATVYLLASLRSPTDSLGRRRESDTPEEAAPADDGEVPRRRSS